MTAPVVPTQQDIDAAKAFYGIIPDEDCIALDEAFARHRLAALEEAARVADRLAELVSTVIAAKGITDPRVAALMSYEQAATAIRSSKEPRS